MRMCAAWIVVISIIIIACLFLIQQFGTGFVGSLFSPVIIVWFVFNTVINLYNIIVYQPSVFRAIGKRLTKHSTTCLQQYKAGMRGTRAARCVLQPQR